MPLILFIFCIKSNALLISPTQINFSLKGPNSKQTLTLTNNENRNLFLKLSLQHRTINEVGEEISKDANHIKFSTKNIFIKPQESKTITLTYRGSQKITFEEAYRLILSPKRNSRSLTAIKYQIPLYARPVGVKSDVMLAKFTLKLNYDEGHVLETEISNWGSAHKVMDQWSLVMFGKKGNQIGVLNSKTVADFPAFNILANSRKTIKIPWPETMKEYPNQMMLKQ